MSLMPDFHKIDFILLLRKLSPVMRCVVGDFLRNVCFMANNLMDSFDFVMLQYIIVQAFRPVHQKRGIFMRRSSVLRFIYGLGLIVAAVGFAMPMIDLGIFGGKFNGFQIANFIGNVPQICLYALFCLCCIGGVLAFIPKTGKIDILIFLLFVIDIGGMVYSFVGGKSGGSSVIWELFGDSVKNLVLDIMQPGAWMFIGGFLVGIITCICRPFVRGKK